MADGSEAEYVAYVNARLQVLRRLAYQLCGSEHEADDLVQETVTKLFVRWSRVRTTGNVDGYVHTMLVRAFLDSRRRGSWRRILLGSPPEREAPPGPAVEGREWVRTALARVPARQRAVLVLRFMQDMSVAETAAVLGCSEGNVKSQTSHGLAALRRVLGNRPLAPGRAR